MKNTFKKKFKIKVSVKKFNIYSKLIQLLIIRRPNNSNCKREYQSWGKMYK